MHRIGRKCLIQSKRLQLYCTGLKFSLSWLALMIQQERPDFTINHALKSHGFVTVEVKSHVSIADNISLCSTLMCHAGWLPALTQHLNSPVQSSSYVNESARIWHRKDKQMDREISHPSLITDNRGACLFSSKCFLFSTKKVECLSGLKRRSKPVENLRLTEATFNEYTEFETSSN